MGKALAWGQQGHWGSLYWKCLERELTFPLGPFHLQSAEQTSGGAGDWEPHQGHRVEQRGPRQEMGGGCGNVVKIE